MEQSIVFHHPLPVEAGGTSGSRVRPYQMLQAFRSLGYEVEEVTGFGAERARSIARVRQQMRRGRRFEFAYAESSTMPTPLTDPHHFPTRPRMDFAFFRTLGSSDVPVGLFYRDVYWRFEHYRQEVPWQKRAVSVPFYRYEWQQYLRSVRHLFLPSLQMLPALPTAWPASRVSALPPGWSNSPDAPRQFEPDAVLSLFYVGGVTPPTYDLRGMVDVVNRSAGVRLTLCCRQDEWRRVEAVYPSVNEGQVRIVHERGAGLDPLYADAAVFLLFRSPNEYLDFAAPIKVFEALGRGLPIITSAGTEAARFVEEEGIGWVVRNESELESLLGRLRERPDEIGRMRNHVLAVRDRHNWLARARTVAERLMPYRSGSY